MTTTAPPRPPAPPRSPVRRHRRRRLVPSAASDHERALAWRSVAVLLGLALLVGSLATWLGGPSPAPACAPPPPAGEIEPATRVAP